VDRNLKSFFYFPQMIFLFIFGQRVDKYNLILEGKVGVTERPRPLNPGKAMAMAICPIIVHVIS